MMSMKAMHKDFWMEIRKSKARFISIFMIVALGVAFFSGIQASSPDMRFSGDAYYDETNLMDIKVMGTLGLTEEDVAAIKQVDGVENAEGAYGTDVMCGEGEKQKVLHVEAVNQTMNRISVTEGKAPEKSGEIFLDCIFAESNGYKVGDQITLKEGGDSELLKKTDYTVVGLGESPLYISYNRGNSTLGSGEVNGFAYVLPEDFDQEVYTQIYVQAHGAQDLISYTDAYDSLIERVQEQVEGIEAERCQIRYDEIVEEANDKLADARQELEDGKKEADEKLADARQELEDGKKKLKDGRMIQREVLLLLVCPKCKHCILNYLWYAKANGRFQDWDENKIIRGKKADEIFSRRIEDYVLVDLPNPFKPKANAKQSMKLSWTYYKTVDSCSQIPRYLNETGDSGLKVVCPIKVTKI